MSLPRKQRYNRFCGWAVGGQVWEQEGRDGQRQKVHKEMTKIGEHLDTTRNLVQ